MANEPRVLSGTVLSNDPVNESVLRLVVRFEVAWGPAEPGQFVQIDCPPCDRFGLWRPFSLAMSRAAAGGASIEIVYGVVGSRTAGLAAVRPGSALRVLGPLGKPFRVHADRVPVLVGGGRGMAPMLFLESEIARSDNERWRRGLLLHGVRSHGFVIPASEARLPIHLASEDGSVGTRGTVITLLDRLIADSAISPSEIAVYACGPNKMLEALSRWAAPERIPCQVSLETHFGCGIGICAACAVPVLQPEDGVGDFGRYRFACLDGPVMEGSTVDWPGVVE